MHLRHIWIHLGSYNAFKCLKANCYAEVTDYQMELYPFLSYFESEDYPYWYDVPCDEIWNRLKTTGYLKQRIRSSNPERMESWKWDVEYLGEKNEIKTSWNV